MTNAVTRTETAIKMDWVGDSARQDQGRQFIKKAKKSDRKRKMEKASRKRNRK